MVERFRGRGTEERLGDARALADQWETGVGAIVPGADPDGLISHGADLVITLGHSNLGSSSFLSAVEAAFRNFVPRVVVGGYDPENRSLLARLSVRLKATLIAPALLLRASKNSLQATGLDTAGKRARQIRVPLERTAVIAMRDGVAHPAPVDRLRTGDVMSQSVKSRPEAIVRRRRLPVDPATSDISHVQRLVCGGRGVGGREGFQTLSRVARLLDAGVAATRVAVDQGWIEYERQVGQTGKTVRPELYLGCGVSGAPHHLDGMSESEHIVAINRDPDAPLMLHAHLALVADLHQVLKHVEQALHERGQ